MVQSRYSLGWVLDSSRACELVSERSPLVAFIRYFCRYYGASLPSLLNAVSLQGFLVINSIVGGQTLASVSKDLSWTVGIVIIGVIALFVSRVASVYILRPTNTT